MMGHSFGKTGLFHHWSPLYDYSTIDRVKISDDLPVPNGLRLNLDNIQEEGIQITFNGTNQKLSNLVRAYLDTKNSTEALNLIKDILIEFNKTKEFDLDPSIQNDPYLHNLIYLINKHNLYKVSGEATKNLAVDSVIKVCQDTRNVQSAHSPIDMATSKIKQFLQDLEAGTIGDEDDNMSIFQLQEDNQTGKKVVGVMANALKAFLTLTQYFNNFYAENKDPDKIAYFLNKINIDGKDYCMSAVANTTLEENQLKVLAQALKEFAGPDLKLVNTDDDTSIILSAMVTLATDNAKELALAKLHASLNLASMHTYLLSMGVPFEEVKKYTANSKLFTDLYDLTKANVWESMSGKLTKSTWKALKEQASLFSPQQKEDIKQGYSEEDVEQLQNLYNWAREFRTFTQLLGINGGMKNGISKTIQFKLQFESIIKNRALSLEINTSLRDLINPDLKDPLEYVKSIIKSHGLLPTPKLIKFYKEQIDEIINKYGDKSEIVDVPLSELYIDMNRYYTDKDYQQAIVSLYNILKATINIFDVINHSPNFNAMLEALNTITARISKGAKGQVLFKNLREMYNPKQALLAGLNVPLFINENIIKGAQSFCDDYFVSDFLLSKVDPQYSFNYSIEQLEGDKVVTKGRSVRFNTNEGLKAFEQAFKLMIIKLKRGSKGRSLLKDLISYKRADGKILYKLNFNLDTLNRDQAGEQQLKYNQIVGGFQEIKDIKLSSLLNGYFQLGNSKELTVGDMFYLYNLIFNLGQRGQNSLTSLLDKYIIDSTEDSLPVQYLKTISDFDSLRKEMIVDQDKLNYHLFKRYIQQKSNLEGFDLYEVKNHSDQILTNLDKVNDYKILETVYQKFISVYRSGKIQVDIDLNCN